MSIKEDESYVSSNIPVDIALTADWRGFVSNAGKAVSELFVKGPAEASVSGISSLVDLAGSFKVQRSPGNLAWILIVTAASWSLARAIALNEESRKRSVDLVREFIEEKKSHLKENGIDLPQDFLNRPSRAELYKQLAEHLTEGLDGHVRISPEVLKVKLDSGFSIAIFNLINRQSDFYAPLFSLIKRPVPTSASLAKSWEHYRRRLIDDFEVKSVFGQELENISLSQLYVPLRGTWHDVIYDHAEAEKFERPASNITLIDTSLDKSLDDNEPDDWLRLIGGGPGSGKSTTLKALARRYAEEIGWRPLFIPLQHIGVAGDLKESVNRFFLERSDNSFTDAPLSRESVEDGAPLLLIFDGLDELAAPGEAAKDMVATFATRLHSLYAALSGSSHRIVKVVVSGRMPAFQAAMRYLPTKPSAAIETYGFLPTQPPSEKEPLWKEDQRPQWWRQYAAATDQSPEVPEALSNDRLNGITNEPLLCYLLALSGYANDHWELAADNRNRIYSALIDSIYERGWGEGVIKRLGPGRTLTKLDFRKLMETIALAAWLGGDSRIASAEKFEETIEITDAQNAWDSFTNDNGQDVANLAMNFYLKSPDNNQRGFEFTHKSFGEYLAASALYNIAQNVARDAKRKIDYALQDWLKATRTGTSTNEILTFLRDEVRLDLETSSEESVLQIKESFEILIRTVSQDGFPMLSSSSSWRDLERQQANSEAALWIVANSATLGLSERHDSSALLSINWNSDDSLSNVLHRLIRFNDENIIFQCLSSLDASGQTIEGCRLLHADFSLSNFSETLFVSCLISGTFAETKLDGARFYQCVIDDASFYKTSLTGTIFHASLIRTASFADSKLSETYFSPITFLSSMLEISPEESEGVIIMENSENSLERLKKRVEERLDRMMSVPSVVNAELVGDGRAEN